ncbi:hypothetical protein ACLM5H_03925 [Fredinandcohnia humi]
MKTKKILVALAVFIFMFIGAWWLNDQTKRNYMGESPEGENRDREVQIQSIDYMQTEEVMFPKFRPREYIRIDGR